MTRDPLEMIAAAAAGCEPDPVIWQWFCNGCRGHQHGLGLERALGLDYAGGLRRRNAALAAAAVALRGEREVSSWDLARELAARVRRFGPKAARWRRTGEADDLDAVDRELLRAELAGVPQTTSSKNLYRIIVLHCDAEDTRPVALSATPGDDRGTPTKRQAL